MKNQQAKFYRKAFTSLVGILRCDAALQDIPEFKADLDALVRAVQSSMESYFELVAFCTSVRSKGEISAKQAIVLQHVSDVGLYSTQVKRHIREKQKFAQAQLTENNQFGNPAWQSWSLLVDALTAQSTLLTQLTEALVATLMREFLF
ncbi:MAG: hypothetical protein JSS86_13255 [Cyanobacteria bacterium SZAS LIN-2]|nr:hypothetical protein [Cyanobacteria bacterium SZAS LIN-3]MBS1997279.1 hypothetical protein [Cyanobacteria bacterium SZAS LIN-2]